MTKKEAKEKIEILKEALDWCVENEEGFRQIDLLYLLAKSYKNTGHRVEQIEGIREIKKLNKVDDFISTCIYLDIKDALNITRGKAKTKLINLDFTEKEKNIILKLYSTSVLEYLDEIKSI